MPPAWAGFGSTASPATAVLASTSTSTAPVAGMGQAAMPPMMPITNMAARGAVGPASQYDFRPNLIPRSPAGG
ncbi:MAG TPA: hypothetical protein VFQ37_13380 [Mycobacterium sp.]|nr:hypothetical protein [Mycobacterium sp.]